MTKALLTSPGRSANASLLADVERTATLCLDVCLHPHEAREPVLRSTTCSCILQHRECRYADIARSIAEYRIAHSYPASSDGIGPPAAALENIASTSSAVACALSAPDDANSPCRTAATKVAS